MKKRYFLFQIIYILLFLGVITTVYVLLGKFTTQEIVTYSKDNSSKLLTADGLITTSTFAFVGFTSLSPGSSGSSTSIRRLD